MLAVIDLDVISKPKEMKKSPTYSALRKNSAIMLMGDNVSKNAVDNLKITYDYFYRKDKKLVLKKKQLVRYASSLMNAIEIVKVEQKVSDEDIFVLGRNLEFLEDNSYQVFDLDDRFTDIYESTSEFDAFTKRIVYR